MERLMDTKIEAIFIEQLLEHKTTVNNKSRSKSTIEAKEIMWKSIQDQLFQASGKTFTTDYLRTKWCNMQERIKGKLAQRTSTGSAGGKDCVLTENDKAILEVLGKDNPKVARVPGAMDSQALSICSTSRALEGAE